MDYSYIPTHKPFSPHYQLVSQPLNGENYDSWSRDIENAIRERNMFGYVDGSFPRPDERDLPSRASWEWHNGLARYWLLNSISKEIAAIMDSHDSAAAIWRALRDLFDKNSSASKRPRDVGSYIALNNPFNPHYQLVSQLLTGENYDSWSRDMEIAIRTRNMFGFVDGSTPRPDDRDLPLVASWEWHNKLVRSWLLNSTSKEIASIVNSEDSAAAIWSALRDLFGKNSSASKRARTDGSRREDDWTCPSCGNVNFSFMTTCNLHSCTQTRPENHNLQSAIKPLQVPQGFSSSAPHVGSSAPSSMHLGVPPYGSSLFNRPSILPYDVPFSGQSAYHYDDRSSRSAGSPYRPLHLSVPAPSMMENAGVYGLPPLVDRFGPRMPIGPGTMASESDKNSEQNFPEGGWKCEKCNNINYPFSTKCNRQGCGADKPAE